MSHDEEKMLLFHSKLERTFDLQKCNERSIDSLVFLVQMKLMMTIGVNLILMILDAQTVEKGSWLLCLAF